MSTAHLTHICCVNLCRGRDCTGKNHEDIFRTNLYFFQNVEKNTHFEKNVPVFLPVWVFE